MEWKPITHHLGEFSLLLSLVVVFREQTFYGADTVPHSLFS